jgi:hypothetical protein
MMKYGAGSGKRVEPWRDAVISPYQDQVLAANPLGIQQCGRKVTSAYHRKFVAGRPEQQLNNATVVQTQPCAVVYGSEQRVIDQSDNVVRIGSDHVTKFLYFRGINALNDTHYIVESRSRRKVDPEEVTSDISQDIDSLR